MQREVLDYFNVWAKIARGVADTGPLGFTLTIVAD
jgi:hypothetical protein